VHGIAETLRTNRAPSDLTRTLTVYGRRLAEATIKDLLAKLPAAWRLAGLKPEERLVGLDPAHAVLALPVEVLRGLAPGYVATLPDDVQAVVRARLAR
jgi:hypothetical protein